MKRLLASLAVCLCALGFAGAAAASAMQSPDITGEAFDLDSGALLYRELYFCEGQATAARSCEVLYQDPEGGVIARKVIDYSRSRQAPELHVNDYRQARELRLDFTDQPELVVDAGFDNFVRLQWDALVAGEQVRFPFLVPGRDSPIRMRARADDSGQCDADEFCLTISLDSWLLGSLVDPIELTYARDSRRLLRFRGLSNIRSSSGKSQQVDIRYRYDDQADASASALNTLVEPVAR